MNMTDYQRAAAVFAQYPTLGHPLVYLALGLTGEAGEVAEKVKKLCRDDGGDLTEERREGIKNELGDVFWYLSETARQAGLTLAEVAQANLDKLTSRQARGVLTGDGDNR